MKKKVHKKFSELKDMSLSIGRNYLLPSIMDGKSTHQGILGTVRTSEKKWFLKIPERKKWVLILTSAPEATRD